MLLGLDLCFAAPTQPLTTAAEVLNGLQKTYQIDNDKSISSIREARNFGAQTTMAEEVARYEKRTA